MAVQTQIQTRRGTAASWTSTNPTLAAGEIGFESDTNKFKIGTGSTAWGSLAYAGGATAVTYLFNATAAQTTFSGADANSLTLAYTVGSEQVYLNGALLVRSSDYTATNGTSIVLTSGALVNDVLNVIAYSVMTITDTYTQAQADAKFFQTANAFLAGKNKIINGDFGINQRGFTTTTTNNLYTFDRFQSKATDGTSTFTAQTFTPGTAPVAGYEATNYLDIASTGQTLTSARTALAQQIESVRTFANQTVTISFWAKAASGTPSVAYYVTQGFGTGGSPSSTVVTNGNKVAITTSWARYSFTVAIPSIAGKTIGTNKDDFFAILIVTSAGSDFNTHTNSLGIQTTTISIWGVQVEAGSTATPFQTATGTKQGELAACQRYYYRIPALTAADRYLGNGVAYSATASLIGFTYPVTMRMRPTALEQSGTAADYATFRANSSTDNCTAVPAFANTTSSSMGWVTSTSANLVAGNATMFYTNNTNAYLGWSAEL